MTIDKILHNEHTHIYMQARKSQNFRLFQFNAINIHYKGVLKLKYAARI